jgi:hypothetical protein
MAADPAEPPARAAAGLTGSVPSAASWQAAKGQPRTGTGHMSLPCLEGRNLWRA